MEFNGFATIKNIIEDYLHTWKDIDCIFKLIIIKITTYNKNTLQ